MVVVLKVASVVLCAVVVLTALFGFGDASVPQLLGLLAAAIGCYVTSTFGP